MEKESYQYEFCEQVVKFGRGLVSLLKKRTHEKSEFLDESLNLVIKV